MSLAIAEAMLLEIFRADKAMLPKRVRSESRERPVVRARQAMMLALHERVHWSSKQIATFLGLSDHTTVLYGTKKARALVATSSSFAALIEALMTAPPIMPTVLEEQIARLKAGLEPVLQDKPRMITVAEIEERKEAALRAIEQKRSALERLRDDVNDDGHDWSAFDWRTGLWANRNHHSYGKSVDDNGECQESRLIHRNLIAGSRRLLAAIEQARAA